MATRSSLMARRQSWLRTDLSTTAALQSVCLGDWVKGGFLYRSQFDRNHQNGNLSQTRLAYI
jgi:hypothetical protein